VRRFVPAALARVWGNLSLNFPANEGRAFRLHLYRRVRFGRVCEQREWRDIFMENSAIERIERDPNYQELRQRRSSFGWKLTIVMLIVYYGFILLVAFAKDLLAMRIGDGVMTVGIPLGLAVIVFTVLITGFYVRRANSEFDDLTEKVKREALK